MGDRLCVVMPVYNEREAIAPVLEKWVVALDELGVDYVIRPYNDGSKDDSLAVMREVAERLNSDPARAGRPGRIEVRDKPNGGHGNTVLTGYRDAAADGFGAFSPPPPTISSNYFKKLNYASPLILVTSTFVLSPGKLSYKSVSEYGFV